jgi:hypothetical protein
MESVLVISQCPSRSSMRSSSLLCMQCYYSIFITVPSPTSALTTTAHNCTISARWLPSLVIPNSAGNPVGLARNVAVICWMTVEPAELVAAGALIEEMDVGGARELAQENRAAATGLRSARSSARTAVWLVIRKSRRSWVPRLDVSNFSYSNCMIILRRGKASNMVMLVTQSEIL